MPQATADVDIITGQGHQDLEVAALRKLYHDKQWAISDMLVVCKLPCELSIRHRRTRLKRYTVQPILPHGIVAVLSIPESGNKTFRAPSR